MRYKYILLSSQQNSSKGIEEEELTESKIFQTLNASNVGEAQRSSMIKMWNNKLIYSQEFNDDSVNSDTADFNKSFDTEKKFVASVNGDLILMKNNLQEYFLKLFYLW
jgi:hypothetical protein